ncbi:uncharacterized protein [Venturia canescens]|uniref:uncharacterized protein n=1 Tax=Venturia canescens TaxID=32260 RepID=UPI001C9C5B2F|nr:uncharacterized protein LOC122407261 [Venturia canescens]
MESTGMIDGNETTVRQEGRKLWQYLAACSASLLAVGVGTALAWTSPVLPKLSAEGSWFPVSEEEGSWVSSLLAIGAIAGALPSGTLSEKIGRKKALLALAGPFLVSWLVIIFARVVWLLCLARFLVGTAVGASCVLVPTYISEIAEPSARGTLGAMFQLFLALGIVLAFVVGAAVPYTAFAITCGVVEALFVATFFFMPESPTWLIGQGRRSEASHALGIFRGDVYDTNIELSNLENEMEKNSSKKSSVFDLIKTRGNRKAVLASFGMMAFQQLSGINAVIFYTVTIFEAAGSDMDPDLAAIIVALVQAVMAGVAALIVDRAGRKPLLIFSSFTMAVSLVALGVYFKIQANGSDVSNLGWLPLSSLVIFMIAFSVGLGPIPWMLMGELFTSETKAIASSLAVMLNWFLVFLVTKTFPSMKEGLGAATTFWIFAAIMGLSTVFSLLALPETKGKTLQEIQLELNGISPKNSRNAYGDKMTEEGSKFLQYFAAMAGNLCVVAGGAMLGWTSPVLPKMESVPPSKDSPIDRPVTTSEGSWIGSLVPLGAVFGSFFAGYVTERWGRKRTLLGSVVLFTIGWALIATASEVLQLYAARFISGFALAIPFTVLPMYVGEIAETSIRGTLGSFLQLFITVGLLWSYCIGPYVTYTEFWIACAILPFVFFASFFFMPESPYWLLAKDRRDDAIDSLVRLRRKSRDAVKTECDEMQAAVEEANRSAATWLDLYRVKTNFKALIYTCVLVTGQQMSGINVVLLYSQDIFIQASDPGSGLETSVSTIIVGVVQLLASCVTPLVVDRLGRRILLVVSGIGEVTSLAALGYFFYIKEQSENSADAAMLVDSVKSWLPVLSLVVFIALYSIGWGPLPWGIMGEMFASDVKAKASSITVCVCWLLGFLITKFFSDIALAFGNSTAFWIFAVFSGLAVLFAIFILPETKGKSLEQIQAELGGTSASSGAHSDRKDLGDKY